MRSLLVDKGGYVAVRTPQMFDSKLWKTSGHWDHYADNMFSFGADEGDVEPEVQDERIMGLKPMNCPSHMLIFAAQKRSYRELPLRICDQRRATETSTRRARRTHSVSAVLSGRCPLVRDGGAD